MQYLKTEEINEPKKDEIVAVRIKDMMNVEITDVNSSAIYDETKFQHGFCLNQYVVGSVIANFICNEIERKELISCVILLKYIGDGKFLESYTGKEINFGVDNPNCIDMYSDFAKEYDFAKKYKIHYDDSINFMKSLNIFTNSPLYIDNWMPFTSDIQCTIGEQRKNKELIKDIINNIYNSSVNTIKSDLKQIIQHDIDYAYGEDEIRTLKKLHK